MSRKPTSPLALRISVTDRCQLRCLYCMPPEGLPKAPCKDILRYEEILRFVRAMNRHWGLSKVHVTGREPLVRRGIVDFIAMLAGEGIADLAMTTNGLALAESAGPLKRAGLKRVNVSLDSLRSDTFATLTRGGDLRAALAGIDAARREGLSPVKVNVTVLRGINSDELVNIARFGLERSCQVRFIELMPVGTCVQTNGRHEAWFVPADEVLRVLAGEFDLTPMPRPEGGSTRPYRARGRAGAEGIIGVIPSLSQPFCGDCRRLRLTASGRLLGCLAREEGPNIRPMLAGADDAPLIAATEAAMGLKRRDRRFDRQQAMVKIGG